MLPRLHEPLLYARSRASCQYSFSFFHWLCLVHTFLQGHLLIIRYMIFIQTRQRCDSCLATDDSLTASNSCPTSEKEFNHHRRYQDHDGTSRFRRPVGWPNTCSRELDAGLCRLPPGLHHQSCSQRVMILVSQERKPLVARATTRGQTVSGLQRLFPPLFSFATQHASHASAAAELANAAF